MTQATPEITWSDPADIVYGKALSETQLDAEVSLNWNLVYTPDTGTALGAGNEQTLHVEFTPNDTVNYTNASKDVELMSASNS